MKNITLKFLMLFVVAFSFTSISCSNDDDSVQPSAALNDTEVLAEGEANADKSVETAKLSDLYEVKKYVFVRTAGANGLGHVGVAFELRARISGKTYTTFYSGAIEGTNGWFGIPKALIVPGQNNGGWHYKNSTQAQMFNEFRARKYNAYKFSQNFVTITIARSNSGKTKLEEFPLRGYNVAGNNCMNAAHNILSIFSFPGDAGNPAVPFSYKPNSWYNSLQVNAGWSTSRSL